MSENFSEKNNLKELIIIIEKLTNIALKENFYLKKMDLEKLEEFSEEKLALVFLMTKMKKNIQDSKLYKDDIFEEEKNKVKKQYENLENLMKKNLILTEYAMSANRKFLESLNKYYLGKMNKVTLYDHKGNKV